MADTMVTRPVAAHSVPRSSRVWKLGFSMACRSWPSTRLKPRPLPNWVTITIGSSLPEPPCSRAEKAVARICLSG